MGAIQGTREPILGSMQLNKLKFQILCVFQAQYRVQVSFIKTEQNEGMEGLQW